MSRILISGQWLWPHYQEACAKALESLGHEVVRFGWGQHFYDVSPNREPQFRSFLAQRQNKYLIGPLISRINREFLETARRTSPDIIWLYNDTHILPSTVQKARTEHPRSIFAQYANDNPWGARQSAMTWRHFKRSVPLFDVNFCYRPSNLVDLRNTGARRAEVLRSYYIDTETFPVDPAGIDDKFKCDVVFAGHYEPDGRLDMLAAIADSGCRLRLFGTHWDVHLQQLPSGHPLRELMPIRPVRGPEYRMAICGATIVLAFLSKLNEDSYTRRSFEIPAMKAFMMSEYTDDLNSMFSEGIDAEYFRNKEELVTKVRSYLGRPDDIRRIATNGFERVRRDGHDVVSRMKQFLETVSSVKR